MDSQAPETPVNNSINAREFDTFGFITAKMRSGFLTAVVGLQTVAIIVLFVMLTRARQDNERLQRELYEKLIDYLRPPVEQMNRTASKVDSVTNSIKAKGN